MILNPAGLADRRLLAALCATSGRFRSHVFQVLLLFSCFCACGLLAGEAEAQGRIPTKVGPISLSGSVGVTAEGYATRGIAARRDPLSAQAQVSLSAQASRLFSYGINLALSTQRVSFGQSLNTPLNRGAIDLKYHWVALSAGNVAPSVSKYTMQGTTMRGGFVEMTPGPLLLTVTGGRAREAVEPGSSLDRIAPAYERWVFAGRLGLGQQRGNHFHLIGLYGHDDAASIGRTDQAQPAQNLNLATDVGFALFARKLSFRGLGALSLFTRDSQGEYLDLSGTPVPVWFTDRFALTTSTSAGLAGEFDVALQLQAVQLKAGYERVQPGYESMGLTRPRSDQERMQAQARFSLFERRLRLGVRGDQQRNNLLGQLGATRYRRQFGLDAQAQLAAPLALTLGYNGMQNEVLLSAQATRGVPRDLLMHTVTVAPALTLGSGETRHSITMGATVQWADDRAAAPGSAAAETARQQSLMLNANYAVTLPSRLALTAASNLAAVEAGGVETVNLGLNVGANRAFWDNKLAVSLTAGHAVTSTERPVPAGAGSFSVARQTLNASARYQVPFGGDLSLTLRGLNAQASAPAPSYQEIQTSLSYSRRL